MIIEAELVGFVELTVGSTEIKVPLRRVRDPDADTPLAMFAMEGPSYAILVRDRNRSASMMEAVESACEEAVRQLSKKLLN
ncbi:MAG: hypothetical protein U0271_20020 [Polyangiaceae bacterium]